MDIIWMVGTLLTVRFGLQALGVPMPGVVAVLAAMAVATWRLTRAGESWASAGLTWPPSWWKALLWVPAIYIAIALLSALVVAPMARALGWPPLAIEKLGLVPGNAGSLALFLLVAWTTAAFGEELLFRGFLMQRLQAAFGGQGMAVAAAVAAQALLFGVAHAYLGMRGAVMAGVVGVVMGVVYVLNGRNLVPLIVAHGLIDTVSLTALWVGVKPPG